MFFIVVVVLGLAVTSMIAMHRLDVQRALVAEGLERQARCVGALGALRNDKAVGELVGGLDGAGVDGRLQSEGYSRD